MGLLQPTRCMCPVSVLCYCCCTAALLQGGASSDEEAQQDGDEEDDDGDEELDQDEEGDEEEDGEGDEDEDEDEDGFGGYGDDEDDEEEAGMGKRAAKRARRLMEDGEQEPGEGLLRWRQAIGARMAWRGLRACTLQCLWGWTTGAGVGKGA